MPAKFQPTSFAGAALLPFLSIWSAPSRRSFRTYLYVIYLTSLREPNGIPSREPFLFVRFGLCMPRFSSFHLCVIGIGHGGRG
jgi:hypothetical protein